MAENPDDMRGFIGLWTQEEAEVIRVKCDFCGHVYDKSRGNCPMCRTKHFDSLKELDEHYLNKPNSKLNSSMREWLKKVRLKMRGD